MASISHGVHKRRTYKLGTCIKWQGGYQKLEYPSYSTAVLLKIQHNYEVMLIYI